MNYSILINGEEVATAIPDLAALFVEVLINRLQDPNLVITLCRSGEETIAQTEEAATITAVDEI